MKNQERFSKNENFTCKNDQLPARSSVYIPHHERTEDEILPEASYGMGAENIILVLRSKIKGLRSKMEASHVDHIKSKTIKQHGLDFLSSRHASSFSTARLHSGEHRKMGPLICPPA
ncbi:uncharacterized protein LOC111863113 isoform X1 [Cryptotermes secundus]|uniref:uncharacterized protein LOC111863113 isoform X1 n=1 Tax=Cryptotermes secundus TaxID=105785 RepID=UPI000CD7D366|nr:uncharacterized protein LOC111863113 isoform X1 [Cryptotermes secundus]